MSTYMLEAPVQPVRWVAAIPLAVVATFLIFAFMVRLVFTTIEAPEETELANVDFPVYTHDVFDTRKDIEKPEKPEVQEPPAPPQEKNVDPDVGDLKIAYRGPVTDGIRNGPSISIDTMPVPQVRVQPRYPNRAIERGLEGYVDVRFDITKIGTTSNVIVVNANPEGVFDRAAVKAVQRWKYQPQLVEGEAIETKNITHRIVFAMED